MKVSFSSRQRKYQHWASVLLWNDRSYWFTKLSNFYSSKPCKAVNIHCRQEDLMMTWWHFHQKMKENKEMLLSHLTDLMRRIWNRMGISTILKQSFSESCVYVTFGSRYAILLNFNPWKLIFLLEREDCLICLYGRVTLNLIIHIEPSFPHNCMWHNSFKTLTHAYQFSSRFQDPPSDRISKLYCHI